MKYAPGDRVRILVGRAEGVDATVTKLSRTSPQRGLWVRLDEHIDGMPRGELAYDHYEVEPSAKEQEHG